MWIHPGQRIGNILNHESQNLAALFRLFIERQFSQASAVIVEASSPSFKIKGNVCRAEHARTPRFGYCRVNLAGPSARNGNSANPDAKRAEWCGAVVKFHNAAVETEPCGQALFLAAP
jgi:hypothetical protein